MNSYQYSLFDSPNLVKTPVLTSDDFSYKMKNFISENKFEKTIVDDLHVGKILTKRYINEYWTSKQRQTHSIHEISYRACYKAQLPSFFISQLSQEGDIVFDPFSGRGTTVIEANLLSRIGFANDVNPLSVILAKPRLNPPTAKQVIDRLETIVFDLDSKPDIDLSMFYHKKTEAEIVSLKNYLAIQNYENKNDNIDDWIRMVATNRLTGHSSGFFSVYTLPPNQATTQKNQQKINVKRKQTPDYRNVKEIIIKKTISLLRDFNSVDLTQPGKEHQFFIGDARRIEGICDNTVQLTVTSPPFLDIVDYKTDNWLRCWFNSISLEDIEKNLSILKSIQKWEEFIQDVFYELFRITKPKGWVAFEVGEVRKGKVNLDEHVIPIGAKAGFNLFGVIVNQQDFFKTSNMWGIKNNISGTNTNRIVLFQKD